MTDLFHIKDMKNAKFFVYGCITVCFALGPLKLTFISKIFSKLLSLFWFPNISQFHLKLI